MRRGLFVSAGVVALTCVGLAATAVVGCTQLVDPCQGVSGACLAVHVDRTSTLTHVDALQLVTTVAGVATQRTLTPAGTRGTPLPVAFAVVLDDAMARPSTIRVDVVAIVAGAAFGIDDDQCSGKTLAAGTSCNISVHAQPSVAGAAMGTLTVGDGVVVASLPLTAVALTPGSLGITPAMKGFGTLNAGSSASQTFTINNSGGSVTGALALTLGGSGASSFAIASDGCSGMMLQPSASCMVDVTFAPTGGGDVAASLAVSATPGGQTAASLSGTGIAPAMVTLSPVAAAFAAQQQGTASKPVTFTIKNAGSQPSGTVMVSVVNGNNGDFPISVMSCAALDPNAQCTVDVTFQPTGSGMRMATLSASASPGGTATAPLTGTATPPPDLSTPVQND